MSDQIKARIDTLIANLLPNGAGPLTEIKLRSALEQVAAVAYTEGKSYGISGIISADQAAEEIGVSPRRMREIIRVRHERFGVGAHFGQVWLIHRDELDMLRPDTKHRRKEV